MVMRYIDFKDGILRELHKNSTGLTWLELKKRLHLPYEQPCPSWVERLEQEIGLSRTKGAGRAYVWKVRPKK